MSGPDAVLPAQPAVVAGSGLAALAAVVAEVGAPLQPVLVLWFVLVCPGLAVVGLLRLPSRLFALTLAVALSCALAVVVAQALLLAGAWRPMVGLLILLALTTLAAVPQLLGARTTSRPSAGAHRGGAR